MSTTSYIIIIWAVFLIGVYAHFFYEVKAREINFGEKLTKLRDAFTEEE